MVDRWDESVLSWYGVVLPYMSSVFIFISTFFLSPYVDNLGCQFIYTPIWCQQGYSSQIYSKDDPVPYWKTKWSFLSNPIYHDHLNDHVPILSILALHRIPKTLVERCIIFASHFQDHLVTIITHEHTHMPLCPFIPKWKCGTYE